MMFRIGERVVYPMHGIGQVDTIVTRTVADQPQRFYQILLEGKDEGDVFVPVDGAESLGLRRAMQADEVAPAVERLQQEPVRQPDRGQSVDHYTWCKERLRQGDALGLAEVRRFLHDLQRVESINNPNLRQLRSYVCEQLPAEIAQALGCPKSTADAVIDKALTSKRPVNIPAPSQP
jgi:CarD family transcriptional regulator